MKTWDDYRAMLQDRQIPASEREAQRVSFVYGQTKFRNPHVTVDDIQLWLDESDGIIRSTTT